MIIIRMIFRSLPIGDFCVAFPDIIRSSDNSCSWHFCDWIEKHTTVLNLQGSVNEKSLFSELWAVTCGGIFTIASLFVIYLWIKKYRLRYLLRFSLFILFTMLSFNLLCFVKPQFQEWVDDDYAENICFIKKGFGRNVTLYFAVYTTIISIVRFHWSIPFNIQRKLNSVTFTGARNTSKTLLKSAKKLTEDKLLAGILKELPPVFPNGWIPIIESSKLHFKETVTVAAIGRKFCVFRSSDGSAYVVDAFCPHLGAELAAGGRVINNCIECPFHGWQFDGKTGKCLKIPYADKIPDVAKIKTWQSCEKNGFVFVWFHAEQEKPSWEMPSVANVEKGLWYFRGRTEHEVHCHIQEIPENGADVAHLHMVHSQSIFATQHKFGLILDSILNCVEHEWQPCGWDPDDKRPFIGRIKLSQRMRICGISLPFFSLEMDIEQIGPATVHLHLNTCFGRGVLLQHIIPEGPLSHRIIHLLYTEAKFGQLPADLLILSEAIMLERDIAVWNNKCYLKKPILVKEDKLITRFRRWYSQFYSEHSPTLMDIKERTLDW